MPWRLRSRQIKTEQGPAQGPAIGDLDPPAHAVALVQPGNPRGEIQPQAGTPGRRVDALDIIGLALDHLLRITGTVVIDGQHQLLALFTDTDQQRMTGVADGISDDIADHRTDQFPVEETQRTEIADLTAGDDPTAAQQLLAPSQLRADKIVHLMVIRA